VDHGDWQELEPGPRERCGNVGGAGFSKFQLPETGLDGNLPATRYAQELPVPGVLDQCFRRRTQQGVILAEPKESMGVEEQCHSMYSLKSSSGASKSGAIQNSLFR